MGVHCGKLAGNVGLDLPLRVLRSAAGFYIGTSNEDGPVSRESIEYFETEDIAQSALKSGIWHQRSSAGIAEVEKMSKTPPVPCGFKVGDRVTFKNDYGVTFERHLVIGFRETDGVAENYLPGKFIYVDLDCWWCPLEPSSLTLEA